jgi:CHAT domain-containing protein
MARNITALPDISAWNARPHGRRRVCSIDFINLIVWIALIASAPASFAQDQEARLLEPGKPIEREIAGGQSHQYRFRLQEKQFIYIIVEQRGIDLVVSAFGPDGRKLVEMDCPNLSQGPEPIRLIATVAGEYRLEARSSEPRAATGQYEARIEELRASSPQDETRIAAQAAFAEGMQLISAPKIEARRKALEKIESALLLFREVGDRSGEANALQVLGFLNSLLGGKQKALEYYGQELQLRRELKDGRGEAQSLGNLGVIYNVMGEAQQALEHYRQALPLLRAYNNRRIEAVTLNNIAALYKELGDLRQASRYLDQALLKFETERDRRGQAMALNNLGQIHSTLGARAKALEFYEWALSISREIKDAQIEAGALHNIGLIYDAMGETAKALDQFNHALPMLRAAGDRYLEAVTLAALGRIHHALGDRDKALEYLEQALPLSQATRHRQAEAFTRYHLARVKLDGGDLPAAREHAAEMLKIVDSLHEKIGGGPLRASFLSTAQQYYEFTIDLFMRSHAERPNEGYDAAALETNERAIARSLLESLGEANADIRSGVDVSLLEQERALGRRLTARAEAQARLRVSPAQAAALNQEIESLITEYREVQAKIRAVSPRYAALTQPVPLKLQEIQRQVLGEDTLLLEYALGAERSYLWAVTTSSIQGYELPKREIIEAAVRRVYDRFSEGSMSPGRSGVDPSITLSKMLLGPVADRLRGKRLLIVATGALQYVPFGALPAPMAGRRRDRGMEGRRDGGRAAPTTYNRQPLISGHEIVNLPSASTLAVLRRELGGRPSAAKQLAVLADPVFDPSDSLVNLGAGGEGRRPQADRATSEPGAEIPQTGYERLRSTRREAEEIIALAKSDAGMKALDFNANRERATSKELADYQIVHFATHGLLDTARPELSGLVFSLVDEKGAPQNGFLRAHEVYNLKLGADLVVLSGCRTAIGKEVKGEGLLSLTRGFMYAGAPRVMASLWRTPDKATAELMKRFYRGLLVESLSPAAALRAAQIAVRREKRWAAPYYWAAFVLQGEWK